MTFDANLASSLLEDLRHLTRGWLLPIDELTLKRDSVVLRRLLIDGILQRYRRSLGLKGEPRVVAVDLRSVISPRPMGKIKLAASGGATVEGVFIAGAVLAEGDADSVPQRESPPLKAYRLSNFLSEPCLVLEGQAVSRRELIKYVANKIGGVHYDTKRKPDEHAFRALDAFGYSAVIHGKNMMFFEFLSLGQLLLGSPEVAGLLPEGAELGPNSITDSDPAA